MPAETPAPAPAHPELAGLLARKEQLTDKLKLPYVQADATIKARVALHLKQVTERIAELSK